MQIKREWIFQVLVSAIGFLIVFHLQAATKKLENIDKKFEKMEKQIDRLEQNIFESKAVYIALKERVKGVEQSCTRVEKKVDSM